jgi:hypothetical protein
MTYRKIGSDLDNEIVGDRGKSRRDIFKMDKGKEEGAFD